MGRIPVERIPGRKKILQPLQRVIHLQQRSISVVAQPTIHILGQSAQIDDLAMLLELHSIGFTEYRSTTGRQHTAAAAGRELCQNLLFQIPEALLPLPLKKRTDRAAYPLLDHVIGVLKRDAQTTSKMAAYR